MNGVPMLASSCDGEALFEWWCGSRKLSAYVSAGNVELIRVAGVNSIETTENADASDVAAATRWLFGEP